ncbi:putative HMG box family protein [Rosellinia necatrix]|uniref:Putative HMG box family protein n=1 Tax=Rosellinia necatrix TaxID=77044 RepID=A0A1W2TIP9_ROSNE|nr:putative HMG box family protein [Rosellinia necatrix]
MSDNMNHQNLEFSRRWAEASIQLTSSVKTIKLTIASFLSLGPQGQSHFLHNSQLLLRKATEFIRDDSEPRRVYLGNPDDIEQETSGVISRLPGVTPEVNLQAVQNHQAPAGHSGEQTIDAVPASDNIEVAGGKKKLKIPPNGFFRFRISRSRALRAENPGMHQGAISGIVKEEWSAMADAEKIPWLTDARIELDAFKKDNPTYFKDRMLSRKRAREEEEEYRLKRQRVAVSSPAEQSVASMPPPASVPMPPVQQHQFSMAPQEYVPVPPVQQNQFLVGPQARAPMSPAQQPENAVYQTPEPTMHQPQASNEYLSYQNPPPETSYDFLNQQLQDLQESLYPNFESPVYQGQAEVFAPQFQQAGPATAAQPAVLSTVQPAVLSTVQPAVLSTVQPAVLSTVQPTVQPTTPPVVQPTTPPVVRPATPSTAAPSTPQSTASPFGTSFEDSFDTSYDTSFGTTIENLNGTQPCDGVVDDAQPASPKINNPDGNETRNDQGTEGQEQQANQTAEELPSLFLDDDFNEWDSQNIFCMDSLYE